jgi:hypothetical protein
MGSRVPRYCTALIAFSGERPESPHSRHLMGPSDHGWTADGLVRRAVFRGALEAGPAFHPPGSAVAVLELCG